MSVFHTQAVLNPGKIQEYKISSHGMEGKSSHANFQISFFSSSVVNVTFSLKKSFEYLSYSVIESALPTDIRKSETEKTVELDSGDDKVVMGRESSLLSFYDKAGNLLNDDEQGLGTTWNGEQVTTYKK